MFIAVWLTAMWVVLFFSPSKKMKAFLSEGKLFFCRDSPILSQAAKEHKPGTGRWCQ